MNVDLLSSHFVIIAICGCKFETLIVNHILTFLVQHVASSFWIVNFRLICINLRFVLRFTWVHFRKYYLQVGELQHARRTCIPALLNPLINLVTGLLFFIHLFYFLHVIYTPKQ